MGEGPVDGLPFVDEHARTVAASPDATWRAAHDVMSRPLGDLGAGYARLIGARDGNGFRVAGSDPPRRLALIGEHAFSRYALVFTAEPLGDGTTTVLRAETRAAFPGLHGRAYRALVIDSRIHVLMVRRMLRQIARRAERPVGS